MKVRIIILVIHSIALIILGFIYFSRPSPI